jgi:hypothetical protein
MNRHLVLLVALLLATVRLAATDLDPKSWYRAVTAQDRPAGWGEENWKLYVDTVRNLPNTTVESNSVVRAWPKIEGKRLLEYLDPNSVSNKFLPTRLVSAENILSPAEEAKAKLEAKDKASDAEDNRPPPVSDGKGIPLLSTRDAPFADEDTPTMKGTGKNKGPKPADVADGAPLAATGNKFAKPPGPQQGTKKGDTLFKNQRGADTPPPAPEKPAQPTEYRNHFIPCWADPQDNGFGATDLRRVLVRQSGQKPRSMTLREAKNAGYVPEEVTYSSLPKEPY